MKLFRRDTRFYEKKEEESIKSYTYSDIKKAPSTFLESETSNITYITCVLQCLANIKPIVKYYLKERKNIMKYMDIAKYNYLLSRIIFNMYSFPEEENKDKNTFIPMETFRHIFLQDFPSFNGNSTKNAESFLNNLLNKLNEEQKEIIKAEKDNNNNNNNINNKESENITAKNPVLFDYYEKLINNDNSLIFNCFSYIIQKEFKCPQENHKKKYEYQNFFTYDLNFPEYINKDLEIANNNKNFNERNYNINIIECLKKSLEKLTLYNVYCSECKQKCTKDRKNSIYITPNYLIFLTGLRASKEDESKYAKRFDIKNTKDRLIFKLDEKLDPKDISDIISNKRSHKEYYLTGFIAFNYDEINAQNNYYISYYINPIDRCWYKYSKNDVEKIDKEVISTVFIKNSYIPSILFYSHAE